jgi:hypothetical protein
MGAGKLDHVHGHGAVPAAVYTSTLALNNKRERKITFATAAETPPTKNHS